MPRRNQYVLILTLFFALVCYYRAGGAHGRRYAGMADAFITALSEIRDRYLFYNADDDRQLFEAAMEGMLDKLDRNSAFRGEAATRKFHEQIEQEFGGIGIEVSWDRETNMLTVLSPMVGTPAYEAGMMPGDQILAINGESTHDFTLLDAVDRLRGKPGEAVTLRVLHEGGAEPVELTITRDTINVNTVLGDARRPDGTWDFRLQADPRIGYIRLEQFGEKTVAEFHQALETLRKENVQGLILDLRGNPGGLLSAANDVCDQFIKSGVIVTTQDRSRNIIEQYDATGGAQYADWPLAVLIDGNSASASEIVSACLQDHNRAVIVGERSFGKGTVQAPIDLEGGRSMMLLTIAGFWRPNGHNIHREPNAKDSDEWGVSPTAGYEVELTDEQRLDIAKDRRRRDAPQPAAATPPPDAKLLDPQLQKAFDYLREKIGAAPAAAAKAA